MTGDVTISTDSSCLVMTTEILRSMLYRGSEVMREVKTNFGMQIDPHSAIGVGAARQAVLPDHVPIVSLATAHPAKFPKAVYEAYDQAPDTPERVTQMLSRDEHFTPIGNHLADVQALIRDKARR